jgi:hypothetical protein
VEGVLAVGAVDLGLLEQLPAVEDRLGVDARGAAAGRADLEAQVRLLGRRRLADVAEDRAGDDVRAGLEALPLDLVGREAQEVADVLLVVARDRGGDLLGAAGGERALAARVGEDALLAVGARGLGVGADDRLGRGPWPAWRGAWRPGGGR